MQEAQISGWNGSGVWVVSGTGLPYVFNTIISETVANTFNSDVATGFNNCVTRDGQGQMAATFLPSVTNSYDVGSASFMWRTGYFATALVLGTASPVSNIFINEAASVSGNLYGLNCVNSSAGTTAASAAALGNGTHNFTCSMNGASFTTSGINRQDGAIISTDGAGGFTYGTASSSPVYGIIGGAEKFRFTPTGTSFLLGKTASALTTVGLQSNYSTGQTDVVVSASECMNIVRLTSFGNVIRFLETDGTTICGTIVTSSGATAYNTTSDVRLKTDIIDAPDCGGVIDSIKVREFKFRRDLSKTHCGFIAQELHEVVPDAVSVGDNGDVVADPWGVDMAKLVPLLIKECQDLRARVAALEAKT